MTFSVDDLVASFNSGGHIGQEAIDIANLQAQLAQTLAYAQHQHQQQFASPTHALCNTPTTARTPTTSLGNWSAFEQHQHRARSRSSSVVEGGGMATSMETVNEDMEMDEDEELAVEQLLSPQTQVQPMPVRYRGRAESLCAQQQNHSHAYAPTPASPSHMRGALADPEPMFVNDSSSPLSTSFAASDPFFAAAAAESTRQSQNHIQQSSFFAQIGRPSQQSPFFAAAAAQANTTTSPQNQFGTVRFASAAAVDS